MNQDGPSLIIEALEFFSSDYFHILHIVELCVILRCLWGLEIYIYKMFMSSVDQFILI